MVPQTWLHLQVEGSGVNILTTTKTQPVRSDFVMEIPIFIDLLPFDHSSHIGGQEQKHFSLLGTKLYFPVNSLRKNSIILTPNMAALSGGCKPRIQSNDTTEKGK